VNCPDVTLSARLSVPLCRQQRRRLLILLQLVGDRFQTLLVLSLAFSVEASKGYGDKAEKKDGQHDVRYPKRNDLLVGELHTGCVEIGRV